MVERNNDGRFVYADVLDEQNVHKENAAKETDATLHERKRVQDNEYTKIDKYSEGRCWVCDKRDFILSTLIWGCPKCIDKRGFDGIMGFVTRKMKHEVCDVHNENDYYQMNCSQININVCQSCMRRVIRNHRKFQREGGVKSSPYAKKLQKIYGKDWSKVLGNGITRDQTKGQMFARK